MLICSSKIPHPFILFFRSIPSFILNDISSSSFLKQQILMKTKYYRQGNQT